MSKFKNQKQLDSICEFSCVSLFFKENKKELLDGYNSALNRIFKIINNI